MKNGNKDIYIFTSCSPELKKEQITLWEILEELKVEWKLKKGITLKYNYYTPSVITSENPTVDYDIFIGVVWTRFSLATFPPGSATYDDFQRAYARCSKADDPAKILFFIKDYPIPPSKIDGEGLSQLQKFLQPIKGKKNLCTFYYDRDEFSRIARQYLSRQLAVLTNEGTKEAKIKSQKPIRDVAHVLYRVAHNTDTLQQYLEKLPRLLVCYFNASSAKVILLNHKKTIKYFFIYNKERNKLLQKENVDQISTEDQTLINGDVVVTPKLIGYPLLLNSVIGGLIVERVANQPSFRYEDQHLLSFIAEQVALSSLYFSKSNERE